MESILERKHACTERAALECVHMERDVAEVLRDALALPTEVRAALIDSLISSLDQTVDAATEEAWREEIYRRLQQLDSGAVQLISWEDARVRLQSRLEQ